MILQDQETGNHLWVGRCNDWVRNYGPREFMAGKGVCGVAIEEGKGQPINLSHIKWDSEYHHFCDTRYVEECLKYGLTPKGVLRFNADDDLICNTTRVSQSLIWEISHVDKDGVFLFPLDDKESFKKRARSGKDMLERYVLLPKWKLVHGEYVIDGIDVRDFTQ